MTVFRNAVFVAAIAGLLAGLAMTAMQIVYTVPLILQAETYEGAGTEDAGALAAEDAHDHAAPGHHHHHGDEAWMPQDGFERNFYTAVINVVTGIGFALLLVAVSELAGGIAGWRQGLFWGLAGFASFTLAPGLGLPPELPGMPAADLMARQFWWITAVAMTAGGIALIVFGRGAVLSVAGAALLVLPHVIGAPQPVDHDTLVPPDLHHRFVVAVTMTNLVFWLVLGAAVGIVRSRFAAGLGAARPRLA